MYVPALLYMTETHWREAGEMRFGPRRDEERAAAREEEERDNRRIQGNCFLSRSSGVCPSAACDTTEEDMKRSTSAERQTPARGC